LNESVIGELNDLCGNLKIRPFPDFADSSPPSYLHMNQHNRRQPSRDFTVGLFGSLHPRKGVITFLEAAELMPDTQFILAGKLERNFSEEQIRFIRKIRPNVLSYLHYIPNESYFNGFVEQCNVVFAAYHDFPHSSNLLSKSAYFRKPIIVSDGFLMASRVRKYGIGEVVEQNNPEAVKTAIEKIKSGIFSYKYDEYNRVHSEENIKHVLITLNHWCPTKDDLISCK
jgi:glycosyltransferase involved in cell wall biosynthesis